MHSTIVHESYVCHRCVAQSLRRRARAGLRDASRSFATAPRRADSGGKNEGNHTRSEEEGAMSRRLKEMTEQSIDEGGRSARKAVQEAGFSDELKKQLEARIRDDKASRIDTTAAAVLSMPNSANATTRDAALATPWTGSENVADSSLRMLQDAHKPLRSGGGGRARRTTAPRLSSLSVDARMKQALQPSKGARLANARDKTSIYAVSQDPNLSEDEKEEMRKILRERFQPGARPMPRTIQGLTSLANERIEDAIARGQFKNIPRGKGVGKEVDHYANSPFINTTEYFMNKMIQRQEIVPPWIEKQQEVVKTASAFRQRLRNDWKRHAARVIASRGGSLDEQVRRAEAYAVAEAELNPKVQQIEAVSQIDATGNLTQLNIVETPAAANDSIDSTITVVETPAGQDAAEVVAKVAATERPSDHALDAISTTEPDDSPTPPSEPLRLPPFRDSQWEEIELAYHSAALKELNNLTRSYNLMAPELAKKGYYSLQRELKSCFADVAPQLAGEIRERARKSPKIKVDVIGHTPGTLLGKFAGETAKVYDSQKPNYGIKEFWRDLWGSSGEEKRA